jgi:bla regulator protein blaR1
VNDLVQIGLTNALLATGLAVVAAVVGKVCRRPALSHALWLVVLLKLLTPPLVVIPMAWPHEEATPPVEAALPVSVVQANAPIEKEPAVIEVAPPAAPAEADPNDEPGPLPRVDAPGPAAVLVNVTQAPESTAPQPDLPWASLFAGFWLTGTVIWLAVAAIRVARFHKLLQLACPAPAELQAETNRLATSFGLRDCPGVWLMPGVWSPLLWAVAGCPRLLLPAGLLSRLDHQQRATLLAHELAHYYRRDHWVRCLEFVATGLYWWLPIVWWVRRELSDAEEECCDAWVVWALPQAAKSYASALVETLDFLSGSQPALPPVASGLGRLPLLRRRLTMIMHGTTPRKLTGLGFLVVVAAAALLLPLWPSWAQQQSPTDPTAKTPVNVGQQQPQNPPDLKRTAEELAKLKQYLDMLKEDYEKKAAILRAAEKEERQRAAERAKAAYAKTSPMSIEQRLTEIEKKLDQVLIQVRDLQKQFGKKSTAAVPYLHYNQDLVYPANPHGMMPGQNPIYPPTPQPKKSDPGMSNFAPVFPGKGAPPRDLVPGTFDNLPDAAPKIAPGLEQRK